MKKKFLSVTIILTMLLSTLIPLSVSAATSGTCGENLTWELDDNSILTISGSGTMTNWEYYDEVPWYSYTKNIKVIYVDEHAIIGTSGENFVKSRVSALVPFNFFVKGKYNFI